MKDELARDKAVEKMLAQKLRDRATPGNGCPDAEIIAAYFERALPQKERARWEAHFDSCARCQQRIAALVRMDEAGEASLTHPSAKSASAPKKAVAVFTGGRTLRRWAWAAPVLLAVVLGGLWYTGEFGPALYRHTGTVKPSAQTPASPAKTPESPAPLNNQVVSPTPPQAAKIEPAPPQPAQTSAGQAAAGGTLQSAVGVPVHPEQAGAAGESTTKNPETQTADVAATPPKELEARAESSPGARGIVGVANAPRNENQTVVVSPPNVQDREVAGSATQNVTVTVAPQAATAAPPSAGRPEPMALKKAQAVEAEKAAVNRNEEEKAPGQTASGILQGRNAVNLMDQFAPAFRYTRAPSEAGNHGVISTAFLWRVGSQGLIQKQGADEKWTTVASGISEDLLDISFPSYEIGWAVGRHGTVLRSANGGASWGRLASPTDEDLVRVRATSVEAAEVVTRSGVEFITTDGAATWTRVETTR